MIFNDEDLEQEIILNSDFAVINEYLKLEDGWRLLIGRTVFFEDDELSRMNFGNENNVAYYCYPQGDLETLLLLCLERVEGWPPASSAVTAAITNAQACKNAPYAAGK